MNAGRLGQIAPVLLCARHHHGVIYLQMRRPEGYDDLCGPGGILGRRLFNQNWQAVP